MNDRHDTLAKVRIQGDDREWRLVDIVQKPKGTYMSLISYMFQKDATRRPLVGDSIFLLHKLLPINELDITVKAHGA